MKNGLNFSVEAKTKLKDKYFLREELAKDRSPQAIMEISDECLSHFYKAARHLFESHHYVEAADAFLFLILMNAGNHDYWLGLGMSTQMAGDFESAIDAYEMAAIYEIENPVSYFYLAKCLFAMHERQSAHQALEIAILYADDAPEFRDLKKQALVAMEMLDKEM